MNFNRLLIAQAEAWGKTQRIKGKIEADEIAGYDSVVDSEQIRVVYYTIEDFIGHLLELLAAYFPTDCAGTVVRAGKNIHSLAELFARYLPAASIPSAPVPQNQPLQVPYFHLSPEGLERRFKLSNEAHNAGRRQAMCDLLSKGLTGQQREDFEQERSLNNRNINVYTDWLETKIADKTQALVEEERRELERDINKAATKISTFLPYSDTYGPYFIKKLKAEPFLKANEFLQFTREPWYPGLAGFYWLDKADDVAYFRDLITEHLAGHPNEDSPTMRRAIEWLTAEIERLQAPGATAFRKSMFQEENTKTEGLHESAPETPVAAKAAPVSSKAELQLIKPFYTQLLEKIGEAASNVEKRANELGFTFIAPETESILAPQPLDTPAPSTPRPEKLTALPTLLSSADLILGAEFTFDEADQLARAVGLTDEAGNYCLGPRKLGAVVGFALALQHAGKLTGAIPTLTAVLGPRWGVQVATRKMTTTVAQHYFSLTTKALTRPKKTD